MNGKIFQNGTLVYACASVALPRTLRHERRVNRVPISTLLFVYSTTEDDKHMHHPLPSTYEHVYTCIRTLVCLPHLLDSLPLAPDMVVERRLAS